MRLRRPFRAAAGLIGLSCAGAGMAQVSDPIVAAPVLRVGPGPSTTAGGEDRLSVVPVVEVAYDSNVLRLNDLRGSGPRDDVRVTPGVAVRAQRRFGPHSLRVAGAVGYDFFDRFDGLERLRVDVTAGGDLRVGARCRLRPETQILVQQTQVEELGAPTGNTSRVVTASATARCPRPAGFFPVARAELLRISNSGGRQDLNRSNWSLLGGVVFARPSLGEVQFFAGGGRFRRPNRLGGQDDEATLMNLGVQFDRAVTSRFITRASVSAVEVEPNRPGVSGFSGFNYLVELRIRPIPRLLLSPIASRVTSAATNASATYALVERIGLDADLALGARSGLILGAGREDRRFFGEDPVIAGQIRGADETEQVRGGVRYDLRGLRLQASIARQTRDSRNDFFDFASTRAELGARARF